MPTDWDDSDIAIIGMAGRFPGATNIDDFRRNLLNGVESVKFFADEELKASGIDPGLLRDPQYVKAAACLDGVETFDAEFFGYNPNEAALMDPQHRILLECAWSALEHAGYDALTYRGTVGVFAGATVNTYLLLNVAANPDLLDSLEDIQINIANAGDFLTTRISYKLNLRGPSHVVQSACSTSLVAVHVACQSLLNEECDLALAGGVSVNEKLKRGYRYIKGGMMSPDGRCRAFDAGAQGTIFGSGVGLVVLKRMKEAIADRDSIQAVIKGSAINNDGSLKVGYVAPSVEGQARVITEALAVAGIEPHTVSYIEAHGTGTPLGDPIEIQALTKAFTSARKTDQKWKCAVGSVKTNIGHLDAAAGAAGLIKTVIALKEKLLPPSLNFEKPNPQINFDAGPFYVNQTLKQWETDHWPRRAGVSAFGVGGTNAHVVLEEAPQPLGSESTRLLKLLILSAKSVSALDHACANLKDYLRTQPEVNMDDLAYTLQLGRHAFDHRCMFVCRDARDAVGALEHSETKAAKAHEDAGEDERIFRSVKQSGDKKIAFAFPGQGVRYRNIGRGLYLEVTSFRKQIDLCDEILQPLLGRSLKEFLYPPQGSAPEPSAEPFLQNTEADVIQPALFALEYATAKLWMSWGVRPSAMIGHSLGEYVAACIAGVVTLEDALSLVTARGKLMRRLPAEK